MACNSLHNAFFSASKYRLSTSIPHISSCFTRSVCYWWLTPSLFSTRYQCTLPQWPQQGQRAARGSSGSDACCPRPGLVARPNLKEVGRVQICLEVENQQLETISNVHTGGEQLMGLLGRSLGGTRGSQVEHVVAVSLGVSMSRGMWTEHTAGWAGVAARAGSPRAHPYLQNAFQDKLRGCKANNF